MRVVHFLNQFFAGLGGEEQANLPVRVIDGAVGPGQLLQRALGADAKVVATIASGDNYFNEEPDAAHAAVREALAAHRPDIVVAGPALNAGRYGLACGAVCAIAQDAGIPAVTAMYPENPGVLEWGRQVYVVPTAESPAAMADYVEAMARLALKQARGEELGPAAEEGYLPRGVRKPGLREHRGSRRAVDMLAARLHGRPFETELPIEMPEQVTPAVFEGDLASTTIGLITCGGLVPKGNPDRLVRGGATNYLAYSLAGLDTMSADAWESVHRGFYTGIVNEEPNYILPLDVIRDMQAAGEIGGVLDTLFTTSGVGTAVADAKNIGAGIARELKDAGVRAAVMVAT